MYLLETLYHSLDDDEVSASAKNTRAPLGVEVLYGAFKKWGYQTFFQEDLCWYNIWRIGLSDLDQRKVSSAQHYGFSEYCEMGWDSLVELVLSIIAELAARNEAPYL